MKAIEAYCRVLGSMLAGRYVPFVYKGDAFTVYSSNDGGFAVALENYTLDYGFTYDWRDADDFRTECGEFDAYIECSVEFHGEDIEVTFGGQSDHYNDVIDTYKVSIEEDSTELFKAMKDALDSACEYLSEYESEKYADEFGEVDEDQEYERWRDQWYE